MMTVLAFDAERRGRPIRAAELDGYTRRLATAVMEALLHFIGHGEPAPSEGRYDAVIGACVIHMLRDFVEDVAAGYANIPVEYPGACDPATLHPDDPAVREWARARVELAHEHFRRGRAFIARLGNPRRRLAGYAYVARFEWMARVIERDGYRLRADYPERKSAAAGAWMAWRASSSVIR
jgi:phytoene/squalene synthetase